MALGVFTFVLIVGNILKLADLVINKGVDLGNIGKAFILLLPFILSYTIPMAILTAVLLAFGRLAADNETTAMRASGISMLNIAIPVFIVSLILSLLLLILNERIVPESHYKSRIVLKKIGMQNPMALLEPGTFIKGFEDYIIFVYSIEKDEKLKNIRIYQPVGNNNTRVIVAEEGIIESVPNKQALKLELRKGSVEEPSQDDPEKFYKLNFNKYYMTLNMSEADSHGKIEKKQQELKSSELKREIKTFGKKGIDTLPLKIQLHKRIAMSFSPLVFAIIGIPLAIKTRRGEKSISLGLSLLVFVVYWIMMIGVKALAINKVFPAAISMWLPNIILLILGIWIFTFMHKKGHI